MESSTENGFRVVEHPTLGIKVREDGMVFKKCQGQGDALKWTKGHFDIDGYYRVGVKGRTYYVHRLVAEAFIPNPETKPTVDHINRNRSDNRVSNLRWATYREQQYNTSRFLRLVDCGVRACYDQREYGGKYQEELRILFFPNNVSI